MGTSLRSMGHTCKHCWAVSRAYWNSFWSYMEGSSFACHYIAIWKPFSKEQRNNYYSWSAHWYSKTSCNAWCICICYFYKCKSAEGPSSALTPNEPITMPKNRQPKHCAPCKLSGYSKASTCPGKGGWQDCKCTDHAIPKNPWAANWYLTNNFTPTYAILLCLIILWSFLFLF